MQGEPTLPAQPADSDAGICPYLGLEDDPQTCLGYPSPWNVCHHSKPAGEIPLWQQHATCLRVAHTTCSVFQNDGGELPPADLRASAK